MAGRVRHVGTTVLLGLALTVSGCASAPPASDLPADELTRIKLAEEIRKLQLDNDRASSVLGTVLALGPFVTVLIAVLTFGVAVWKQLGDRNAQHRADLEARDKERQARETERSDAIAARERDRQERFDAQFTTAIAQLASTEPGLQAAGAASLLRIQDTAGPALQREILLYCATQLRIGPGPAGLSIVKEVFQAALRAVTADSSGVRPTTLNLAGANLTGVNLSGAPLKGIAVDLSGADLTGANLRGADLFRVTATGARFTAADCANANFGPARLRGCDFRRAALGGARLSSANLQGADLSGASLRGAFVQSAHFDNCILNPTEFDHADVNDAYFTGARVDDATLRSLDSAKNRHTAHGLPDRPAP